ncbi:MAG: L-rhamnose isomerase [Oscillospiraceae bacterium]|jgi:L-rhamnose isomerase|nr:L-rhamnose isomerase [Oscillospiraceae bacterium]
MYEYAKEQYAAIGVDTEAALNLLDTIPISMHCWQGDDVKGFEGGGELTGGIQSTGNHPGAAQNVDELRQMIDTALQSIPGKVRLNLHAIYGMVSDVERNKIEPIHFSQWSDWANERGLSLDFNPTLFSHPNSADGLTLSHPDKGMREFWIEHCIQCRKIAEYFSNNQESICVNNLWIADGFKDIPVDTLTPRIRLVEALDEIYADKYNIIDALESKLFGIGVESYTVGSHEFYMGYAVKNGLAFCMDAGHYHPTEVISAKISAVSLFVDRLLLHVSRPVRWDSDHVVTLDDELIAIAKEIIRHKLLDRVHIGLDYFDGSIDRVSAWIIGMRNMRKALLIALLEPYDTLKTAEWSFDFTKRLMLLEEQKAMPWAAVWSEYCNRMNKPDIIFS